MDKLLSEYKTVVCAGFDGFLHPQSSGWVGSQQQPVGVPILLDIGTVVEYDEMKEAKDA